MEDRLLPSAVLPGFDDDSLPPNDDQSTVPIQLGFTIDFYGRDISSVFVNNNGNVTFDAPSPVFTPYELGAPQRPALIAPFFADVDTHDSGSVSFGKEKIDGRDAFAVTWRDVGYFENHAERTNTFQLVIINRADSAPGDFDLLFNYDRLTWEAGDASGGNAGAGGVAARAGFTDGSGAPGTFYELRGSGVAGALIDANPSGLVRRSLGSSEPGRFVFQARAGQVSPLPSAATDNFSLGVGQAFAVLPPGVLGNDLHPAGDPLSVTEVNGAAQNVGVATPTTAGGSVTMQPDGSFSYAPATGFHGIDAFAYRVSDPFGASAQAAVVIAVNTPPRAVADSGFQMRPGQELVSTRSVLDNDSDADGDPVVVTAVNGGNVGQAVATARGGSVTVAVDGTFAYTPAGGFSGIDSFSYEIADSFGARATASVEIVVNTPPAAAPDAYEVVAGQALTALVLANDVDADGDPLRVVRVNDDPASVGVPIVTTNESFLTLQADGRLSYVGSTNFVGTDVFSYTVADGFGSLTTTTVRVTVLADRPAHFLVSAPASAMAGQPIQVIVTALDDYGNIAPTHTGLVHLSGSSAGAEFSRDAPLVNGVGVFTATLGGAGLQSIIASDGTIVDSTDITVVPGPAARFLLETPDAVRAGESFDVTLTALDAFANVVTAYQGDVSFLSSDSRMSVTPAGPFVNGVATFTVTLRTAQTQSLTVRAATGIGSVSGNIDVRPAPAQRLTIDAPGAARAGTPFEVSITAFDAFDNVADLDSTLILDSSDGRAQLPSVAELLDGVGQFSATLVTAGAHRITASIFSVLTATSDPIAVSAAAAARLDVAAPDRATAGVPFGASVTALDAFDNVVLDHPGPLTLASSDPRASFAAVSFRNGIATVVATLTTAGSQAIRATSGNVVGSSEDIAVRAASARRFQIDGPSAASAGVPFFFDVTALDDFGNRATAFAGTLSFSTNDVLATVPVLAPLNDGAGTFAATLRTAGRRTLTVDSGLITESVAVEVAPASAVRLAVAVAPQTTAGKPVEFTVTALDPFGNVDVNFATAVQLASTEDGAVVTTPVQLAAGNGRFTATFEVAGRQVITATAASNVGGGARIDVTPAAARALVIAAPATATAGAAFSFTVTAFDAFGNVATAFTDSIRFRSSDGASALPGDTTLTDGAGSFSAVFRGAGSRTLDVISELFTDSVTVAVAPAAAVRFTVAAASRTSAGEPVDFTVTALDPFGNVDVNFASAVQLGSSEADAVIASPVQLAGGSGTFAATFTEAGTQTITASAGTAVAGRAVVDVTAAAAAALVVDAAATATAGAALSFTVTALDVFGNLATSYRGPVRFVSTDVRATLPAEALLSAGRGDFSVTYRNAGTQILTVSDPADPALAAGTAAHVVRAGVATRLTLTAARSAVGAGEALALTLNALDAFGNVAAAFPGRIDITSSDPTATVASTPVVAGGRATLAVILRRAGTQTVTARSADGMSASAAVVVTPAGVSRFELSAPSQVIEGQPFALAVTALDRFGNVATNYRGTVTLSSSDAAAILPAAYTFDAADAGRHTFTPLALAASGSQAVQVADAAGAAGGAALSVVNTSPDNLRIALSPGSINQGGVLTVAGSFTDAVVHDAHTVTIAWGDGLAPTVIQLPAGVYSFGASRQLLVPGSKNIRVTVNDVDSAAVSASAAVRVSNVAPVLSAGGNAVVELGRPLVRAGRVSDPLPAGLQLTINFGDGASGPVALAPDGSFRLAHVYDEEGAFVVTLGASDRHGGAATAQFTVNVVFAGISTVNVQSVEPGRSVTTSVAGAVATLLRSAGATAPALLLVANVPPEVAADLISAGVQPRHVYDIRIVGGLDTDRAVVTFHYELQDGAVPLLSFLDHETGALRVVRGSTLVDDSFVIDTAAQTITVVFDRSSFPKLTDLKHTLFTVTVAPSVSLTMPPATARGLPALNAPLVNGTLASALLLTITGTGPGITESIAFVDEPAAPAAPSFVLLAPAVALSPAHVGALNHEAILPVNFDPATHPPTPGNGIVPVPFTDDDEPSGVVPAAAPAQPRPAPRPSVVPAFDEFGLELDLDLDEPFLEVVAAAVSQGRPRTSAATSFDQAGLAAASLLLGIPLVAPAQGGRKRGRRGGRRRR